MRTGCFSAALIPVLLAAAVPSDGAGAAGHHVPLSISMDGRVEVTVRIGDAGPYRFRVDTGASRTVVTTRLTRQLGLQRAGTTHAVTQAGDARLELVRLDGLRLSPNLVLPPITAAIVADSALDPTRRVDGLLGQDAFPVGPYSLDYRSARLTLGASPQSSPAAIRFPLARVSGTVLAVVPAPQPGRTLRLIPDSGADRLVLFAASAGALPPMTILETVRVRSVTGERPARLVRLHGWQVGPLRLGEPDALWIDRPAAGGAMGDGLLPLRLFARVTFNVADGSLELDPRP